MNGSAENEVSCKQAYDLLFSYLEGDLDAPTSHGIEAHLAICPPCMEFLRSYKKTPGLAREALDTEVPPEVTRQLQAFLRSKLKQG